MPITRNISVGTFGRFCGVIAFVISFTSIVNAQTTETRDTLLLGSFNEHGCNVLIHGNAVKRLPAMDWKKFYATPPDYLLTQLKSKALNFHAYVDNNGNWEAIFSDSSILVRNYQEDKTEAIPVRYSCDQLPGQTIMFSNSNGDCYGLIRAVAFKTGEKGSAPLSCAYAINDEEMLFEVFVNYKGKVIKGCGTFEPADKNKAR